MSHIVNKGRPAGQSEEYRFFKNASTGNEFKVKHSFANNPVGDPQITVSVSSVDASGKASEVNEAGEVVLYYHTHVFMPVELSQPGFNPEAVLAQILEKAIADKELDTIARRNLKAMSDKWTTAVPIQLGA